MNVSMMNTSSPSIQVLFGSNGASSNIDATTDLPNITTTVVPIIPVSPPLGKCNYFITGNGSDSEAIVFFKEKWYGGIPQNLAFNLIGWLLLMILFSVLRRAAGNYGRLALVRKDDQDEASKWTQLFYAPDDVTGFALADYPDGPTFASTGNINRIVQRDFDDNVFSPEEENDTSVVAAEEALKEDRHFFAWIVKIFTLSDEKILRKCGTDAVQYLKFQRHLILLVMIMMIMCICVILPINFQGELQGDNSDFGHTTISNLNGSADWLWIHAIMTVLFFPLGILIMRRFSIGLGLTEDVPENYNEGIPNSNETSGQPSYEASMNDADREGNYANRMNGQYNSNRGDLTAASRTLMISGIPSTYCTKEFLQRHFQETYPNIHSKINDIQPAYDVSKLLALDEKRQRARKARIYCEGEVAKHGAGQQMCPYPCGIICMKFDDGCGECSSCCSKRTVDALTFYRDEELRLQGEVEREKARVRTKSIGIAFITFDTREDAKRVASDHRLGNCGACLFWACSFLPNIATKLFCCCRRRPPTSRVSNMVQPLRWNVQFSPPPDDIYWENLNNSYHLFTLKAAFVNVSVFIFLFFFTSPPVLISQLDILLNIKDIGHTLGFPKSISAFWPSLLLLMTTTAIPIIVAYTDWFLGHWRRSHENLWIMRKVFTYLLLVVLILPSIGLTTVRGLVENFIQRGKQGSSFFVDGDTLRWSCIFLPNGGAYFVNYVITAALIGSAFDLLRISELLCYMWKRCTAKSIAEYSFLQDDQILEFMFGFNYGWMLLIFALTAAYAVICPIITPFGLFYLVMKHGVDRYNLYYAYKRSKISKQIHATAVNSVIVSLLIQQLVLLFFNVIRGQRTEGGPGFSPRAIFSITMFTIFLAMFVGQIFFHLFLGFSPIQYNPTSEYPQRSNKNSNRSSRRPSQEGREVNSDKQEREAPKEEIDGTELVYGEFGQFARHTDVGMSIYSHEDTLQNPDDLFGNTRLAIRSNQRAALNNKKNVKRYLPDVLKDDVFAGDTAMYPHPPQNSITNGYRSDNNHSFGENENSFHSRQDAINTSNSYGAIDKQPKGTERSPNAI